MSLKKAVIATRYGGLKEIILNNKTGYLVDKNNPNLYAKKILFGLTNLATSSICPCVSSPTIPLLSQIT